MGVTTRGLTELIAELRGPAFRDVNRELRAAAKPIAAAVLPELAQAVRRSQAPQAHKIAATLRVKSDRVPVISIGAVNPRLSGFRRGAAAKRNRGSIAHGVVYGPLGGRRDTPPAENYYRIGRDPRGGPVAAALDEARNGPAFRAACAAYLDGFLDVLSRHGFTGSPPQWNGG